MDRIQRDGPSTQHGVLQRGGVLGSTRETSIRKHIRNRTYYTEVAHVTMGAKSHDLPSSSWTIKKSSGIILVQVQSPEIKEYS